MRRFLTSTLLISLLLALAGIGMVQVGAVHAQDLATFGEQAGFTTTGDLTSIIARLIRTAISFLGIIVVIFILYGGFLYMTAAGDETRITKAKNTLKNAVIGLVIVLSSFSIVTFILSRLSDATGTGSIIGSDGGGGFTPPGGGTRAKIFALEGSNAAACEGIIQNIRPQLVFTQQVDPATLVGGIVVTNGAVAVPGAFTTSGRTVTFTPTEVCAAAPTERCLPANSTIQITLNPAVLKSASKRPLTCTADPGCSVNYTTGSAVDTRAPSVSMKAPESGSSFRLGDIVSLQAAAIDDVAPAIVSFTAAGDNIFDSSDRTPGTLPGEFLFATDASQWDTAGFEAGRSVAVAASVNDCAGHTANASSVSVFLRADSCFNGQLDTSLGETDVDCGGTGAFSCGACEGQSCTTNADCSATGACENGRCVAVVRIDSISLNDGAPGNFVSINGVGFGTTPGPVAFLGAAAGDATNAQVVSCDTVVQWAPTQIIVQVPAGAKDGPIRITNAAGQIDSSNDDRGATFQPFDVNGVERPGLCAPSVVLPGLGAPGDTVRISASKLGSDRGSSMLFFSDVQASAYLSWGDTLVSAIIPNVNARAHSVQAFVGDNRCTITTTLACERDADCGPAGGVCAFNRQGSNIVKLNVVSSSTTSAPLLSTVSPATGPIGQTITLAGNGFGTTRGTVRLVSAADDSKVALASIDFPAACGDGLWRDDLVTVIVPAAYQGAGGAVQPGVHKMRVVRTPDGTGSNEIDFTITAGVPGPSICKIDPVSGPIGTPLTISGAKLGTQKGTATFFGVAAPVAAPAESSWSADAITNFPVPVGAQTGPMSVQTAGAAGVSSNTLPFQVSDCRQANNVCPVGSECCGNGTCATSCAPSIEEAYYMWRTSTGPIPKVPRVIVQCNDELLSQSPWEGFSTPSHVCLEADVVATFSVGADIAAPIMDITTLTAANIQVEKCAASGSDPCGDGKRTQGPVGVIVPTDSSFKFTHAAPFEPSTRYRVTLKGGSAAGVIRSAAPAFVPMESDYSWEFVTAAAGTACTMGSVSVSPRASLILNVNGKTSFLSAPRDAQDSCIQLPCKVSQGWVWTPVGNPIATLVSPVASIPPNPDGDACRAEATALKETPIGAPLKIRATATDAPGDPFGEADLTITFLEPKVISFIPACDTACINALLEAEFNVAMNPATISTGTVRVFSCINALCLDGLTPVSILAPTYNGFSGKNLLSITTQTDLAPNTYHRVILSGNIESANSIKLSRSGGNFKKRGEDGPTNEDYSWIFRTKSDDSATTINEALCRIVRVEVKPESATVQVIGERAEFVASPFSAPDECSAEGQKIKGTGIVWQPWTSADVADNVPDPVRAAAMLNSPGISGGVQTIATLPAACTSSCVLAGNTLTGLSACGDSTTDLLAGEECDDGNQTNNDGCSSVCLHEGSQATTCGDRFSNPGEECDDGGRVNGDGCSSVCLREGSIVANQCGNGFLDGDVIIGGEECDTLLSPTGCSSECLFTGNSVSNATGRCGNGTIEASAGEQCDGGAKCSSRCLLVGNLNNDCGDGNIDAGEACDDANRLNEDGCSSICLREGSSAFYPTASFCGDTRVGIGEDPACESPSGTAVAAGPYSAMQSLPAAEQEIETDTKIAVTRLTASVGGQSDTATFNMECSCQSDNACGNTNVNGCGLSGCCSVRPTIVSTVPTNGQSSVCRNTEVKVHFDKPMDQASFNDHAYLELVGAGANCPSTHTRVASANGGWFAGFVQSVRDAITWLVGSEANAAPVPGSCIVPITFRTAPNAGGSDVFLQLSQALIPNATYRIVVERDGNASDAIRDGVLSTAGVGLVKGPADTQINFTSSFTTGGTVCGLDAVEVTDLGRTDASDLIKKSPGFFSKQNETHTLHATDLSKQNGQLEPIQPIVGSYSWTHAWVSTPIDTTPENVISLALPVPAPAGPVVQEMIARSVGKNGEETVTVNAAITTDVFNTPTTTGRIVKGTTTLIAFVCENPWPKFDDGIPFVEDGVPVGGGNPVNPTNFSFFFCRDAGAPGEAGDLPDMTDVRVLTSPTSNILKEMLFTLPSTGDAVGVKVIANPDYLPPEIWYQKQLFTGNPSAATVDGYEAVRDGDTLYTLAANQIGDIFPNIYVVSMSNNPNPESRKVFDQVLANFRFNANTDAVTNVNVCVKGNGFVKVNAAGVEDPAGQLIGCTSDLDCSKVAGATCDADKAKLRRDTRRLSDVIRVREALVAYGRTHGHCELTKSQFCTTSFQCPVAASGAFERCLPEVPALAEGSFIRAMSTSAWPSWTDALAKDLGKALPIDPLNKFAGCTGAAADKETCFDSAAGTFQCSVGSHVYGYQSVAGETYTFTSSLEHNGAKWFFPIDANPSDNALLRVEYPPGTPGVSP